MLGRREFLRAAGTSAGGMMVGGVQICYYGKQKTQEKVQKIPLQGAIYQRKNDNGKSWSLVEFTDLSTSDASIRFHRVPSNGDLLIVWNQVTIQEQRNGYGRSCLSTAISRDSGQTWGHFKNLELSPGMNPDTQVIDPQPQFARGGEYTPLISFRIIPFAG
jgi:hypothetical protein